MGKVISYRPEPNPLPNELLLMYRQRSGLTQNQLAAQLNLKSDRMIQKWEGGYSLPTSLRLQSLIQLYLQAGVFIAGKEKEEARRLWQIIKDMFDQNTATYETYPIFDENWFEQLLLQFSNTVQIRVANIEPSQNIVPINRQAGIATTAKTNLPIAPNRLIGRKTEVEALESLLSQPQQGDSPIRLLTLTGAGGTGKTRLAMEVAKKLQTQFEEVWFVPLTSVQDPRLVAFTIAKTLRPNQQPNRNVMELLQNYLAEKKVLLVLDNFEHLLEAGSLVSDLLQYCPLLSVLVTSRILLRLTGEYEFAVAPLKLPPAFGQKAMPSSLYSPSATQYPAITLFVERAQAVKPSFHLDSTNAEAVAQICQHLDGLPLALELAAAWIKMLSPQNLLSRLIDEHAHVKLQMLNTGAIDVPERQKTIWASIHWSYSLLNPAEQTLLRRLSIFTGGWELQAAEAICAGDGLEQSDVLGLLYQLINHSLVVVEESNAPKELRFRLLETIRQYGWERLQEAGELEIFQKQFMEYYLNFTEEAETGLYGLEEKHWRHRLLLDIDNLRAAMSWSLESPDEAERAIVTLRITAALRFFWLRFSVAEGRRWLELALESMPELLKTTPNRWRAKALMRGAIIILFQDDYQTAWGWCEESIAIYNQLNDLPGLVESLRHLSYVFMCLEKYERAILLAEESLELAKKLGDSYLLMVAHAQVGRMKYYQKEYAQMYFHFEETTRLNLELGNLGGIAVMNLYLGRFLVELEDYPKAKELFRESLKVQLAKDDLWAIVNLIYGLIELASAEGKEELIPLLSGTAETLRESVGGKIISDEKSSQDKILERAKALLGEETFQRLYEEGRHMPLEQLVKIWEESEFPS